ncbi:hypothetical protein GYMLUDRAFT_265331 [Collybiopsis luxurians FD-317 M1]|uniref:F-box domain-containing protein n=1 Tax=Collybiopsis luxurians FD-317 M1 TaxID=944289 RepID=A0A0D0BSY5_9AGAR|nr:hypothetical protein GYMLUDRAFT_265331 [Collybiopsis luxurians FD-317 M1]
MNSMLEIFRNAPNIVRLSTRRFQFKRNSAIRPRLNRLTSLTVGVPTQEKMRDVLSSCPNLTWLYLWELLDSSYPGATVTTPPMMSVKVRSFTLGSSRFSAISSDFINAVLATYTFPALDTLCIRSENPSCRLTWPRHAFEHFMARSSCIITSFTIKSLGISDLDLIFILRFLPSLRDLEIHDVREPEGKSPITSLLVSALHGFAGLNKRSNSSGALLVPKLRQLKFRFYGTAFDDAAFVSMVSSRWLPDPNYAGVVGMECLRSVVLYCYSREVDHDIYKPLYSLEKVGMRVVIEEAQRYDSCSVDGLDEE